MKIFQITGLNFNNFNNRQKVAETKTLAISTNAAQLRPQLNQDTVSFTAKIPSIVTPTMEDIINRTKAVDILRFNVLRLAKHDIPCPVCGHIMLDVDKFNDFENKIMDASTPTEILDLIGGLKKYLHPVETKIYSMMREYNAAHPNKSLLQMLKKRLPRAERKIVQQQTKIFSNIGLLSRNLPETERNQIQDLLNETFTRIYDPRETSRFSRHVFIDKLKFAFIPEQEIAKLKTQYEQEFMAKLKRAKNPTFPITNSNMISSSPLVKWGDMIYTMENYVSERLRLNINTRILTPEQEKIMAEAIKLPAAYNNTDAFIVKYAKRNYNGANPDKKIALRMLSNSLATVEHIKAQSKRGTTEPKNLAIECACDNNRRGSASIIEQIVENPMMPIHYRNYMRSLCNLHMKNIVEKSYITQQNKTFRDESLGFLDADLSVIHNRYKRNRPNIKSGITPTQAERRAAKKLKLKLKKQKHNPKTDKFKKH